MTTMPSFVVDTSAFVTIFRREPLREQMEELLGQAERVIVPATCLVELALLRRIAEEMSAWANDLVRRAGYELAPLSLPETLVAVDAARRYGKGSGHIAGLNYGDCLVYAVAKYRDLPLLFAGDDFRQTDVTPALT
jgi:ribonuclease VapC